MIADKKDSGAVLPQGVIFNAYPDSIGGHLKDLHNLMQRSEFKKAFSYFYLLPTFYHSDFDRGFSIVDYDLNEELVTPEPLKGLTDLGAKLKLDLVLNHLSAHAPQFEDLLKYGDASPYYDFFIDWNIFWHEQGTMHQEGYVLPHKEHLEKLFMRKTHLPLLKVYFPDGSKRFFWNTFYQQSAYKKVTTQEIADGLDISLTKSEKLAAIINEAESSAKMNCLLKMDLLPEELEQVMIFLEKKRCYKAQVDLNARSEKVWAFYEQTLRKIEGYGAKIVRLDAFAYLHKAVGYPNFFNRPETWAYLARIKKMAQKYDLFIIPEIHAHYGSNLHAELAANGYPFYDFFSPGLIIDALERGTAVPLLKWISEILTHGYQTINMLGCHDGIPVLDLQGANHKGNNLCGLLEDGQIEKIVHTIQQRGGIVKNLYGPDGRKISYYQVNATFFSALGEDERKLRLARAIQLFMPGMPQVWYLDLFAGKNDDNALKQSGPAGHKEINRTNLCWEEIENGLKRSVVTDQLEMIRLRNLSPAFNGLLTVKDEREQHHLHLQWEHEGSRATLFADLRHYTFRIEEQSKAGQPILLSYS